MPFADIIAGYGIYAPFTFFIKALDAFTAYMVCRFLKKWIKNARFDSLVRLCAAFLGELVMVVGYLLTEAIFYGFPAALTTVLGNVLQGGCCMLLAAAIISVFYPMKEVCRLFPHLKIEE